MEYKSNGIEIYTIILFLFILDLLPKKKLVYWISDNLKYWYKQNEDIIIDENNRTIWNANKLITLEYI